MHTNSNDVNDQRFDVVVITKDRQKLLCIQVERLRKYFPYNQIIVVEGTENLASNYVSWLEKRVNLVHSPNAKLGHARQLGLQECNTEYIFMIDDDIEFKKGFAESSLKAIRQFPDAFALSPVIVFGNNPTLQEIFYSIKKDNEGVSGGCCIIHRETLNTLGGYKTDVHIGEDSELFYRAKRQGYKWIRKSGLYVSHPLTSKQFIFRTWYHRFGSFFPIVYGYETHFSLLAVKLRAFIVNVLRIPRTRKLRLNLYLLASNLVALVTLVRVFIGADDYAYFKKKIV